MPVDADHNLAQPRNACNSAAVVSRRHIIMATVWNRAGHYIFAPWFLSSSVFFLSSPNLSGRMMDVYRTLTYDVVLVRI